MIDRSPAALPLPRRIFLNLEVAEKSYSRQGLHMCPRDGYVCFRNSELICGRIGKVRGLQQPRGNDTCAAGQDACCKICNMGPIWGRFIKGTSPPWAEAQ